MGLVFSVWVAYQSLRWFSIYEMLGPACARQTEHMGERLVAAQKYVYANDDNTRAAVEVLGYSRIG